MKRNQPGMITILWDLRSAYYTWPILASGGAFVFGRNGSDYDLRNIGIPTPGAVNALSEIIGLIRSGILPKVCPYSEREGLWPDPGRQWQGGRFRSRGNRASLNQDVAKEFIERYLLTDEGLSAMPIDIPALISLYEKLAKDNPHLRQLKASMDIGQIMSNVPQMGSFFTSLGAALQLAADGRLSADAALRQAEANIRHE